jgi:GAF domain-containing protein
MARNVAGRLALALENKRLLERSLAQAEREHQASEAASLLLSATDVDAVMRLAADRFNDAMGAVRTRIQLRPEVISEPPAPGRSESETVPETEKESGE